MVPLTGSNENNLLLETFNTKDKYDNSVEVYKQQAEWFMAMHARMTQPCSQAAYFRMSAAAYVEFVVSMGMAYFKDNDLVWRDYDEWTVFLTESCIKEDPVHPQ
jgi:hypothetical protein